ncbi:hypothetical protein EV11_1708 [Prochlorococcus sp. SS52]|nr:hypothetical protein EV04_1960 [Prochlorococcus marinus str. LG]KGG22619.1 hypothetical protein EV08_0034 [Prochlorococcus marinus str. SS2]KGG24228.1 hypothetical protein EV09_0835 [Prochlorococcus marinus str. SS35]KGG33159.1 hypothetical protein EV10_0792 [Prochlorococcus marinus str. SS51]KGG34579.1 hypothetical protein EV11_1708 [Prochlorococcus sp. SS52]
MIFLDTAPPFGFDKYLLPIGSFSYTISRGFLETYYIWRKS